MALKVERGGGGQLVRGREGGGAAGGDGTSTTVRVPDTEGRGSGRGRLRIDGDHDGVVARQRGQSGQVAGVEAVPSSDVRVAQTIVNQLQLQLGVIWQQHQGGDRGAPHHAVPLPDLGHQPHRLSVRHHHAGREVQLVLGAQNGVHRDDVALQYVGVGVELGSVLPEPGGKKPGESEVDQTVLELGQDLPLSLRVLNL